MNENNTITYKVDLFGQTKKDPEIHFLYNRTFIVKNYNELIEECKKVYCRYYECDLYNIITIERLNNIKN